MERTRTHAPTACSPSDQLHMTVTYDQLHMSYITS